MSTRLSFDVFQMGLSGRIEQPAPAGPFRARAAIPDMVMSAKLFSYLSGLAAVETAGEEIAAAHADGRPLRDSM
jgi:hypothetical protein